MFSLPEAPHLSIYMDPASGSEEQSRTPQVTQCDQCQLLFDSPEEVINHQLANHTTQFCVLCKKTFSSKSKWKRHVNCVHGFGKVFKCYHCPKAAYKEEVILKHMAFKHRVYVCLVCKNGFNSKGDLEEHMTCAHVQNDA